MHRFAILIALPIAILSVALAFYRVNDKPFINLVEASFNYFLGHKLYIWRKEERKVVGSKENEVGMGPIQQIQIPKLSESKLKELTWSLDIKENQNPVTKE